MASFVLRSDLELDLHGEVVTLSRVVQRLEVVVDCLETVTKLKHLSIGHEQLVRRCEI